MHGAWRAGYFYRVPSPPASHDGHARPLAGEQGTRPDGGVDVTQDADGEPRATGVGVMSGVADPDAGPPPGEIRGGTEPVPAAAEPVPAAGGTGGGPVPAAGAGEGPADAGDGPADAGDGPADAGDGPADAGDGPGAGEGPADAGEGPGAADPAVAESGTVTAGTALQDAAPDSGEGDPSFGPERDRGADRGAKASAPPPKPGQGPPEGRTAVSGRRAVSGRPGGPARTGVAHRHPSS